MKLYTYCLRYDSGAAPNPYWGICTLAICKPAIRRTAEIGDWIVGLGSAHSPIGDISDHVVYAMKVTGKLTLKEYDQFCKTFVIKKIPDWRSRDYRLRMGDCIYNYVTGENPKMRRGVHNELNKERDLSGQYALLSKQFFYFGSKPVRLPEHLQPIIHTTQGYKSEANEPFIDPFVTWMEALDFRPNKVLANPQLQEQYSRDPDLQATCSARDLKEDT
jgi:hypothetical protein